MASNSSTVLVLGALAVGVWLVGTKRINLGAPGTTPGGTTPPGAPPKTATCDPSFKPGVQYVAQDAQGNFEVVIGGVRKGLYATQAAAEQAYNALVCPK